jgi:excisionase family DNA binding protein
MGKTTYTTSEAADVLGVTVGRVRQLVIDGTLQAEKFGRDLVITAEALETARQRKTTRGRVPKPKASATDGQVNVKPSKKGSKK